MECAVKIVSPSILSCDFLNIEKEICALNRAAEKLGSVWIHLDIMDGHFVPNLTFGIPIVQQITQVASIPLDAHLMVTNPRFHIEQMKNFSLHNITFHLEAVRDCQEAIELVHYAKQFYPSVGISIKPKTVVKDLSLELLQEIDLLLVMSVEPGFGGQSFIDHTFNKLEEVARLKRQHKLSFMVQVDGGVSDKNATQLYQVGVGNLVAGSYIFKADNYLTQIERLRG